MLIVCYKDSVGKVIQGSAMPSLRHPYIQGLLKGSSDTMGPRGILEGSLYATKECRGARRLVRRAAGLHIAIVHPGADAR